MNFWSWWICAHEMEYFSSIDSCLNPYPDVLLSPETIRQLWIESLHSLALSFLVVVNYFRLLVRKKKASLNWPSSSLCCNGGIFVNLLLVHAVFRVTLIASASVCRKVTWSLPQWMPSFYSPAILDAAAKSWKVWWIFFCNATNSVSSTSWCIVYYYCTIIQ